MKIEDVVIIGGGPAGIATALQLARYRINPLLIEKRKIGGLLHNASSVENFLGFPGGIKGEKLVRLFERQLREAGIRILFEEVSILDFENEIFKIRSGDLAIKAKIVVIASGTKPKIFTEIEIPEDVGKRVFYEIAEVKRVKSKDIIVVGAGDAGLDYSLNLARKNRVILISKGDKIKGLPVLQDRLKNFPQIKICNRTSIKEIYYDREYRKILIKCSRETEELRLYGDYIIFAIGREPNMDFISASMIKEVQNLERIGKLYFVGDVKNGIFRQTAIAVGDGIMTAMKIALKIKE